MTTGMHLVSDIFCLGCGKCVGWKYWKASENSQKYKEGKVILERALIVRSDGEEESPESPRAVNWTATRLILPIQSIPINFPAIEEPSDSEGEDF